MGDSPPGTPSPPPPLQSKELQESDTQNPNPTSDTEDPSQNPLPSTSEPPNPPPTNPVDEQNQPEEESHILVEDQDAQDDPDPETEHIEPEGMSITLSTLSHPSMSSDALNIAHETKGNNPPTSSVRRTTKRKKGSKNHVSQVASERKMQQLSQGFNPIPFVPGKALDFARHEELLKKVGLWDFAHVEFDRTIRVDLVVQLIVNYTLKNRGSYVNGLKIGVSRADLGRAFKLPKKVDCDGEVFPAEFLSFLEEFVSNWMLLHEDLWCTPSEIVTWLKLIREGNPHKVDWAGLIWYMMEKELAQRIGLKDCYYASHLQHLMKVQKEELFWENPSLKAENPKVEVEIVKETVAVEDDDHGGDVKMMNFEESGSAEQKLEEQNVDLRLGQDGAEQAENVDDADKVEKDSERHADETEKVDDVGKKEEHDFGISENVDKGVNVDESENVDEGSKVESVETVKIFDNVENTENPKAEENKDVEMMDFGEYKGEEQGFGQGQGQWFLDGKIGGQHFLQRCSMGDVNASEDRRLEDVGEDVEDDEIEEDGHVEGFKIMSKSPLDGMTSANLMQAFEAGQLPFSSTELGGQSSLELMTSRADNNMLLGVSSMFNHAGKREIDHEHDISHQALNDSHKRMRVDGSWDNKSLDVDMYLEHMQHIVEKAKMCNIAAREEAFNQVNMAQHFYSQQLTEKENEIGQFRYKLEDLQRNKQMEVERLNRELYLMNSVIDGYRRALKHTQKSFAEYRKRRQVPDEPMYKDVGLGGVVKSVMELERERLKKEEENKMACNFIEEKFQKIQNDFEVKLEGEVLAKVQSYHGRLMDAVKEVEQLKDDLIRHKTSANVMDAVKEIEQLQDDLIMHMTPANVENEPPRAPSE